MVKSEVYSWRLSPQMKRALEETARRENQSVSALLERIVIRAFRDGAAGQPEKEIVLQKRLHAAGMVSIGRLNGGRANRSTHVRQDLRRKLRRQYDRTRSH
jgi:hypothetical protein